MYVNRVNVYCSGHFLMCLRNLKNLSPPGRALCVKEGWVGWR